MDRIEPTAEQRRDLLLIARHAVAMAAGSDQPGAAPALEQDFAGHGAFVTLHRRGQLRGCIGTFASSDSIVATIREMAAAAAQRDPRFMPVRADELEQLDIEISLLTPLRQVDSPTEVEVGRHGICVEQGFHRGVLLPQVAVENSWDRDTFLNQTCVKAGLRPNTWREGQAKIEVFEAIVFGEHSENLR